MWLSIGLTVLALIAVGVCAFAYSLLKSVEAPKK
ncbi:hypothetical protein O1Q82_00182 [Lonepinella sp. MS14437]